MMFAYALECLDDCLILLWEVGTIARTYVLERRNSEMEHDRKNRERECKHTCLGLLSISVPEQ